MNRLRHRLVFNRARGMLMAVAETATARTCARGERHAAGGGAPLRLRPWSFSLWLALGLVGLAPDAQSQIAGAASAPGAQRPTVLAAPNGVPLVNIQTPSAAGVSRNTYSRFDVDPRGAILNNSRTDVRSQLGGWVQGNPWLARGSARVILNEVQASDPSHLRGYIEVAGQRAQVVVANPAGIACEGCGFVNADRVTLTTGTPVLQGGELTGLRVERGTVTVGGEGLDARASDFTALIAHAVQLDAGVFARDLQVLAGAHEVSLSPQGAVSGAAPLAGTPAAPVAIDVSHLGGMYADAIHLVGHGGGVGVRNAGEIGASAGDVIVSTDGRLENTGRMSARGDLRWDAQTGVSHGGAAFAQGRLDVSTLGDIDQQGLLAAGSDVRLAATGATSTWRASADAVVAAGVQADGQVGTTGRVDAAATARVSAQGRLLAGESIDLRSDQIDLSASQAQADHVSLQARAGDTDLTGATLLATRDLAARAARTLRTDGASLAAARLVLDAQALSNRGGELVQQGGADLALRLAGELDNTGGRIAANGASLRLEAAGLRNAQGRITSTGDLGLIADQVDNAQGQLLAQGALALRVAQGLDNRGGLVAAVADARVAAGAVDNRDGRITSVEGTLDLRADAGALDNRGGHLQAGARVDLQAALGIDNAGGWVQAPRVTLATPGTVVNTAGRVLAAGPAGPGVLSLQSQGLLNDAGGLLQSTGALSLDTQGQALVNTDAGPSGGIVAGGALTVAAGALDNRQGLVASQGDLVLRAGTVVNAAGQLLSTQRLQLEAQSLDNRGGQLQSLGGIHLALQQALDNRAGQVLTDGALRIDAASLDNRAGQVQAGGDLALALRDELDNRAGLLRSGQVLSVGTPRVANDGTQGADQGLEGAEVRLQAQQVSNVGGAVRAVRALVITSEGSIDNTAGWMSSGSVLRLAQATEPSAAAPRSLVVTNRDGTLLAGESLQVDAVALGSDGHLLSQGEIRIRLSQDYRHVGELRANGDVSLETEGHLVNESAMEAAGLLHLKAADLDNQASGRLTGTKVQLEATGAAGLVNRGLVDGLQVDIDAPSLTNLGTGRLYGDHLSIAAGTLVNDVEAGQAAVIAARERLDLGVGTLDNREHALVFSAGDLAIGGALDAQRHAVGEAGEIRNTSATLEALGSLAITARAIRNSDAHFRTENVTLPDQQVVELAGDGSPTRYAPDAPGVSIVNDESDHLVTPEGTFETWHRYEFTRSVTETRIASADPARILSGGDLRLAAASIVNDKAQIVAGGALQVQGASLDNLTLPGQRVTTDVGQVTTTSRNHQKGRDSNAVATAAYAPPVQVETLTLSPSVSRDHDTPPGSAMQMVPVALAPPAMPSPQGVPASVKATAAGLAAVVDLAAAVPASLSAPAVDTGVRAGRIDPRVSNNSLFRVNPDPATHILVETDPRFANDRQWLGSDYLLNALSFDPNAVQKRLGDGFYEQRLIREQVVQLTGRRFLDGFASDEEEYRALMDSGITFAKAHTLRPGVALSAQQMAQLTSDIVWLVEQSVTLPDGRTVQALVPQVYVRPQAGDLQPSGALIAGRTLDVRLSADLANTGTLAGHQALAIDVNNLLNTGGRITGDELLIRTREDLANLGGQIRAGSRMVLDVGRDLRVQSTTTSTSNAQGRRTDLDRVASLYVEAPQGLLVASAGRDLTLTAAEVRSGGALALQAGRDLSLDTVQQSSSHAFANDAANHRSESRSAEAGTTVQAQGDLVLRAGNDLTARAASVTSEQGVVAASAGRDVRITAGQANVQVDEAHQSTSHGFLSSKTITTHKQLDDTTAQASAFSGRTTRVEAGRDIAVTGSQVVSEQGTTLVAGRDVTVEAATETRKTVDERQEKRSGLFSSGGFGFTIGTQRLSTDQQQVATTAAASTVGSVQGDVRIEAGGRYRQVGSDVVTPQGSVDITGGQVDITAARETARTDTQTRFSQSGLSVAVSNPVVGAVQTAQQMQHAAAHTRDARMQALAAATTVMAATHAAQDVASHPAQAGGVNLSVSLGSSRSESHATETRDTAAGSRVVAGRDVTVRAVGQGAQSSLTVEGSQVHADRQVTLQADGDVRLLAARNDTEQASANSSSSASVGVSVGTSGLAFTASASRGRGQADGHDVAWTATHVEGGERVHIASGADTTLRGAVVQGRQVQAQVGGALTIESLQDTSDYASRSSSVGGSLSVGAGPLGANLHAGRSRIDSQYASVTEPSALRAGDGGFQVQVQGATHLQGGAITSTQAAVDAGANRFASEVVTLLDIDNRAAYSASSTSVNLGAGFSPEGKLVPSRSAVGLGSDGGQAASVTRAGISGVAGDANARTGEAGTGLARIFDADKVRQEIEAQVTITREFNVQAGKTIDAYIEGQRRGLLDRAKKATTPEEQARVQQEMQGVNQQERALNILVGAFTGLVGSVITQEALSTAAEKMRNLMIEDSKKFPGVVDSKGNTLTNMSGPSDGVRGDGVKLGGTRVDLDLLCGAANERCKTYIDTEGVNQLALDAKGRVQFDDDAAKMSLATFLDTTPEGKQLRGLTGGVQGWKGTLFGVPYDAGSWQDKLIEAFAGTHDYVGGKLSGLYDDQGNATRGRDRATQRAQEVWSASGAIAVSSPFAAAEGLSPEVWKALTLFLRAAK